MPRHNVKHFIDCKLMTDKIIQTSTGDHGLNIMNTLKKIILTAATQLRKDIVQKQNRLDRKSVV